VKKAFREEYYQRTRVGGLEVRQGTTSIRGVALTFFFTLIGACVVTFIGWILGKGFSTPETHDGLWWAGLFFLGFVELLITILVCGGLRSLYFQINLKQYPTFIYDDGLEIQTKGSTVFIPYANLVKVDVHEVLTLATQKGKFRYSFRSKGMRELVTRLRERCPHVMDKRKFKKAQKESSAS